ncbi:MAG: RsmF rRNA methyltransferase first C-terminal domain-containing protein [bacterium]|nr:RsmF rRNA methyltransferase first C-terminal domain-containing protein [bacterium]
MKLPYKFEERMKAMLGDEYGEFLRAFENEPVYSGIRVNTLRRNAHETVKNAFGALESIPWCADGFYADKSKISGNHPLHLAGLIYFQEPSAMCAASALPIDEGDFVLDLCAAPGGKSTHVGAKLKNTGLLVANEIVRSRAEILSSNIERMGLTNTVVTNESPDRLAEKYPGFFDKIIVDAPCSGEGMFRKEPQAVTEWSLEHTLSCGERQKNILSSALQMLKPGGMLMYSTCTFAPAENEKIAAWLAEKGMQLIEMPELSMLTPGRTEWSGTDTDMSRTRRIFPHKNKGEGHFAALFKKPETTFISVEKCKKKRKSKGKNKKSVNNSALEAAAGLYREFESRVMNVKLDGEPVLFGDRLYLKPKEIDIDNVKVLRCGLELGIIKKNRFEPSHALALALDKTKLKSCINFAADDERLMKYLSGEVIPCALNGWCAVCAEGYGIGWGKCSGGQMKNHYPKGLRLTL